MLPYLTIAEPIIDEFGETYAKLFENFLAQFQLKPEMPLYTHYAEEKASSKQPIFFYREQGAKIISNNRSIMIVDFNHLTSEGGNATDLADGLVRNYYRCESYLNKGLNKFMLNIFKDEVKDKHFNVAFNNLPTTFKIREMRVDKIGKLISVGGTVTRTTEVKPELLFGTFRCLVCYTIIKNVEQQFKYTEPIKCRNPNCGNQTKWELVNDESIFADWQKLRVQENAYEIPPGSMPRCIDVILRHDIVDLAKPGDRCIFTGTLVTIPEVICLLKPGEKAQITRRDEGARREGKGIEGITGMKRLGVRDLNYKLAFIANSVQSQEARFGYANIRDENDETIGKSMTEEEKNIILEMKNTNKLYDKIANSISPTIFGHEDVKKGILLMLFGGNTKTTLDGIKLRGDINICIVGDPSTAKSQFLKYVSAFVPRSVYTSGKASTAAGLTASVIRDEESGEYCIEAGALMLSDNGICCIDEFEKMDIKDQVAIHEAMEQQTISIAKAGIKATLNARASILAAANPIFGRYDRSKKLKFNLNISAPIMSRFDLFFIIVDDRKIETDVQIAKYIVNLHQNVNSDVIKRHFSTDQMQKYIKFARTIKPRFSEEAAILMSNEYQNLRKGDQSAIQNSYRITVRQLESLIRLSEALARVHYREVILKEDVMEACRLLKRSIITVEQSEVNLEEIDFDKVKIREEEKMQDSNLISEKKNTISSDEYYSIVKKLALRIEELSSQGVEGGVMQKDLIEWFIEENLNNIENEFQASELQKKLMMIIDRIITRDGTFFVFEENPDPNQRRLCLNPNYNPIG